MYIPLDKRLEDNRHTRVVIGMPFGTDISSIFENEEAILSMENLFKDSKNSKLVKVIGR